MTTAADEAANEAAGLDLSHLHESVRPIAGLPASDRLGYVRADRWIGYPAANEALQRLETLLAWPSKQRMPNLLVVGPTNNGKSMIIEKFRRDHPVISHPDREEIPVLTVQMPSSPSVTRFYSTILTAMGAPVRSTYRIDALEQIVLRLLRGAGVRMLIIDELHNVFGGAGDRRREFLNLLRFLGNELRLSLVGVGTHEAYLAIRADDQLENRFAPMTLPRWESTHDACSLLASFAAAFPLRRPSPIATPEMTTYLLTRCEGTIGELASLLTDAAVVAIESGEEAINQTTLQVATYAAPAERRRLFELGSRDYSMTSVFSAYIRDNSVLLPVGEIGRDALGSSGRWSGPWQAIRRPPVECPVCAADPDKGKYLVWEMPLTLGCGEHGCYLEPSHAVAIDALEHGRPLPPRRLPEPLATLERYTHSALTTGQVDLPGRTVHAAIWFRLLRSLLYEVSLLMTRRRIRPGPCWSRSGRPQADFRNPASKAGRPTT